MLRHETSTFLINISGADTKGVFSAKVISAVQCRCFQFVVSLLLITC
jgi:hypothetical protein